jgi:hypothetical protein
VKYFDRAGNEAGHSSYHVSGQTHFKKHGKYIYWTDGPSGKWVPMKQMKEKPAQVVDREDASVIGWEVRFLATVLPEIPVDKVFNVRSGFDIVGFKTTIVGPKASSRNSILGFPVLARHRFSNGVDVEVEMFGINAQLARESYGNDEL